MKERDRLGDLGADERIILKLILNKKHVTVWNGLNWIKIGLSF
jgi:hypothetical protein